jgi:hypothetical protein
MLMGQDYVSELQPPTGLLFMWYAQKTSETKQTGENWRTRRKTYPSATLSTTNPTQTDLGANSGLCRDRVAQCSFLHYTIWTWVMRIYNCKLLALFTFCVISSSCYRSTRSSPPSVVYYFTTLSQQLDYTALMTRWQLNDDDEWTKTNRCLKWDSNPWSVFKQ